MKLIMAHWQHGGTAVTNFDLDDLPVYEAALYTVKREDIVLCSAAFRSEYGIKPPKCGSMHCIPMSDLSDFWEAYWPLHAAMRSKI